MTDGKPLTEADLRQIELNTQADQREGRIPDLFVKYRTADILRLVAEVRRLRSDGWLVRSAHEISTNQWGTSTAECAVDYMGDAAIDYVVDILRRHRDEQE